MQPAAAVCIVSLLVSLFDSICGVPAWNSVRQLENKRRKRRSTYNSEGDLRPGGDRWPMIVPVCAEDEYYDVNVQACSRCSDVCRPNIDPTFCATKCREYFGKHFDSHMHPELHSSLVVTAISSSDDARETRITDKPLFWTSVVSMTIAVAATAAIIVLCIRRRKLRTSLVERRESNEDSRVRTLSETSDDREPEHRTLLHNMNGRSPRNTSCRDEERDFEQFNNRPMYTTGGGGEGGGCASDRFATGACNANDRSNFPSMPSPNHDRHQVPEKVLEKNIHNYSVNGLEAANAHKNTDKVGNWKSTEDYWKESSPSLSMSEFAEDRRQLLLSDTGPSSSSFPASLSACKTETSYASSTFEAIQSRETKTLSCFQSNDETIVKENPLVDLYDRRLSRQNSFTMEPKAMGILINNRNAIDDIRKLQISVRPVTDDKHENRIHCTKTVRTLHNPSTDCDDGIATSECTDNPYCYKPN